MGVLSYQVIFQTSWGSCHTERRCVGAICICGGQLCCDKSIQRKIFFCQKCNWKSNFIQHLFSKAHRRHERRMVHHQKLFRFTGSKDIKLIFPSHYCEIIVFSSLTCSNHCIQITERSQVRGLWTGQPSCSWRCHSCHSISIIIDLFLLNSMLSNGRVLWLMMQYSYINPESSAAFLFSTVGSSTPTHPTSSFSAWIQSELA